MPLPDSLESISISGIFNQSLNCVKLPKNLKKLVKQFDRIIYYDPVDHLLQFKIEKRLSKKQLVLEDQKGKFLSNNLRY